MLIKLRKAQSTAEYAILISLVIGAALAMQVYIKRSLQAKMHDAGVALTQVTGEITQGIELGTTLQYEPYYASQKESEITRDSESETTTETDEGGEFTREVEQSIEITEESTDPTHIVEDAD